MKQTGQIVAVYSRKSRFTGKGESIGNQVEMCREYIRSHFGEPAAHSCTVFEDEGFSGGNLKRPAFQRMLEGVRRGEFRAVVVYRLDRVSRNISDFAALVEELGRLNVAFISIREQFDTGSPMGRAMMYIISVFSQLERETIAERIRDNMHELAKTGRWLGGNTPTGYTSESVSYMTLDGKTRKLCRLKLLPDEAETVKTIFDLYSRKNSLTAVETELLQRQLKTKRGKEFTRFGVKGILENPVYMVADAGALEYFRSQGVTVYAPQEAFDGKRGIMAYNRTDQEKGSAAVCLPMAEWIVSVGQHPGLIASAQWIQVQEALARNGSSAYRSPRKNGALLTGLLFCSCGSRMYPKLTGSRQNSGLPAHNYVCKRKERTRKGDCSCPNASGSALDEAVWGEIQKLRPHVPTLVKQLEKSRHLCSEAAQGWESQCQSLQEALDENEKKLESLLDAISLSPSPETKQRIARRMEELEQANNQLHRRINALQNMLASCRLSPEEMDALRGTLRAFDRCAAKMPVEEKRRTLRLAVQKVIWDGSSATLVRTGARMTGKNADKI